MKKLFAILIFSNFVVSGIFVSGNAFKESSLQNKTLNISEVPGNDDPFAKYMESVPMVLQTLSIVNAGTSAEAIVTRRIIFSSRNGTSKVYAIISYPNLPGKYPALLILHGGGGNADGLKPLLERFARNGYVTFTLDMPGICGTRSTPNTEGPWKSRPEYDEAPRFNVANGPEYSTLVDAEIAGIEAFNLLRSQPNVDVSNIGITGFSWGGYSTTLLSGILGKKVKAAYSVFGCGFYELGSFWEKIIDKMSLSDKEVWLKYIDAGRRVKSMKASYFLEATTNDTFFWPEAVRATLNAIPGEKNLVWHPNLNHKQDPSGEKMQKLYFDYYLKGVGSPFIKTNISEVKIQSDGSKKIQIKVSAPKGISITSVALYYSKTDVDWQSRVWIPLAAQQTSDSKYSTTIPENIVREGINFYAYVTDSRNVTTSTSIY